MKKKRQAYLLGGLLLLMLVVFYMNHNSGPSFVGVVTDEHYQPLKVDDPSLRLDLLDRIRTTQYEGNHRNIFTGEPPPPPPSVVKKMEEEAKRRAMPQGPPPLTVPAKFFGYAADPRTGARRAFFTANDDVYVVNQGGILLNNFRILAINNSTVDVQEISSGRKTSLAMDATAAPGGFAGGAMGGAPAMRMGGGMPGMALPNGQVLRPRLPGMMPGGNPAADPTANPADNSTDNSDDLDSPP